MEWCRDGYLISTDPGLLDREAIWRFLRTSYWSPGVPRELGVWLVGTALGHPDLEGLRIVLATADAHGLYERFGFRAVDGRRMMERPGGASPKPE